MVKKTLIAIATIALLAIPALAPPNPQLGYTMVPVTMDIDKTVTFEVENGGIELFSLYGTDTYVGQTTVTMYHNFPVLLRATIAPQGEPIALSYRVAISKFVDPMPFPNEDGTDQRLFPTSAPGGEAFFLGAKLTNVNISLSNSAGPQIVAEILLEACDIPL